MLNYDAEESVPEPMVISHIQIVGQRSKHDRLALTDRSSLTNQTARQYHCYQELRQAKRDLEACRLSRQLDQTIRNQSDSAECRSIFDTLDRFRDSFRTLYFNQETREDIISLFYQLKRDLASLDSSGLNSPRLSQTSSEDDADRSNEARNLDLMQTLYQKLAYIKELQKKISLEIANSPITFTALQKSSLPPSPFQHNADILEFRCEDGVGTSTQTDPCHADFIQVIDVFKVVFKRYIIACNLVWKLIYKLVTPDADFVKQYRLSNNQLLVWYSRLKYRVSRYDLREAREYMQECQKRAQPLDRFVCVVNRTISCYD